MKDSVINYDNTTYCFPSWLSSCFRDFKTIIEQYYYNAALSICLRVDEDLSID